MRLRLLLVFAITALLLNAAWGGSGGTNFIVKMKQGGSIRQLNKDQGTETIRQIPNTRIYLIHADDDDKALRKILRNSNVEDAEVDRRFRLNSTASLLDPRLVQEMVSMLDPHTVTTFNGSTVLKAYAEQIAVRLVRADLVRSISTGAGTHVAFMDTGVDFHHQALKPWLDPGVDALSHRTASEFEGLSQEMISMLDQEMVSMLDPEMISMLDPEMVSMLDGRCHCRYFGHGTLVAGLIHLVAPDARLVPIKAFDANGYTTIFSIVEGVYWAIGQDIDVLNLSFSTEADSDILHKAIDDAKAGGIAVVASVGNDSHGGRDLYPAAYGTVYGVAATDSNDRLASFSNYGKSVSVTAPGAFVISTFPGGRYAAVWGTSFSAPLVSGAVAVIASGRGHGQSDSALVVTTADFIDNLNPGFERKLGKGRINVHQALKVRR